MLIKLKFLKTDYLLLPLLGMKRKTANTKMSVYMCYVVLRLEISALGKSLKGFEIEWAETLTLLALKNN